MTILEVIAARRDGGPNTPEQLKYLARAAADLATGAKSEVEPYQFSAWLMAAYLNPLSLQETRDLTAAMANSGERVDLTGLPKPWLDKHSTGGVGDKTTLVVLPILAACGLHIGKMSGRGLGITGGTIDKLGCIPGLRLDLSPQQVHDQVQRIGIGLTGQSSVLAPADKELYKLRDVTGTVASLPLIVSSIVSKKLAGGAEMVAYDVKAGSGAFMPTLTKANELAEWLIQIGNDLGLKSVAAITDMDQPLGRTVGNALEVVEAGEVLCGAQSRFYEHCIAMAGLALNLAGIAITIGEGQTLAAQTLANGKALEKAREWIQAQGGDPEVWEKPDVLPKAPVILEVVADRSGWISEVNAGKIGEFAMELGAGRKRAEDNIEPAVGLEILIEVGDQVQKGQRIGKIHARAQQNTSQFLQAIKIGPDPVQQRPVVLGYKGLS